MGKLKIDTKVSPVVILKAMECQKASFSLLEELKGYGMDFPSEGLVYLEDDPYTRALINFNFSEVSSLFIKLGLSMKDPSIKVHFQEVLNWFHNPDWDTVLKCDAIKALARARTLFEEGLTNFFKTDTGWNITKKLDGELVLSYSIGGQNASFL